MHRSSLFLTALIWCALGPAGQVANDVSEAARVQARRPKGRRRQRALRAMPVLPSPKRLLLLDKFVRSIQDILPRLDLLYITAGHDEDAIGINLVTPGRFTLTPVNNPGSWKTARARRRRSRRSRGRRVLSTPTSAPRTTRSDDRRQCRD